MRSLSLHNLSITLIILLLIPQSVSGYELSGSFLDTQKNEVKYTSYEGAYLLVDTFATWCEPCKAQMPHLSALYSEFGDQMSFLSLDIDPNETIKQVIDFKNEFSGVWKFGIDKSEDFANTYEVEVIPTLFLFAANGSLVETWIGITGIDQIENTIYDLRIAERPTVPFNAYLQVLFTELTFWIIVGTMAISISYIVYSNRPAVN